MTGIIYKIVPAELWAEAESAGVFGGAPIDLTDGYIHLSTGAQVRRTAELYFKGQDDLLLVAVDGDRLGDALKYEASRGGDLFPHLYGPLSLDAVLWRVPMPVREDGHHDFPEGID
ncbi:MAG: DUF952 domain-containing protein [Rhizobium sp.]|nr:DUF952 domain-containing protein [Rhizobium sp.]